MGSEFTKKNLKLWEEKINTIFPKGIPEICEWSDINQIVNVLNVICEENLNHIFYPDGGGLDITKVTLSHEDRCINIYSSNSYAIIKPSKLIFHSSNKINEWAYFRIETNELERSGIYEELPSDYEAVHPNYEELVCVDNKKYIDRCYWDMCFYYDENGNEQEFSYNDSVVSRFLNGAFVVFAKGSEYNKISETYDGRHNKMSDKEFNSYIKTLIK